MSKIGKANYNFEQLLKLGIDGLDIGPKTVQPRFGKGIGRSQNKIQYRIPPKTVGNSFWRG